MGAGRGRGLPGVCALQGTSGFQTLYPSTSYRHRRGANGYKPSPSPNDSDDAAQHSSRSLGIGRPDFRVPGFLIARPRDVHNEPIYSGSAVSAIATNVDRWSRGRRWAGGGDYLHDHKSFRRLTLACSPVEQLSFIMPVLKSTSPSDLEYKIVMKSENEWYFP